MAGRKRHADGKRIRELLRQLPPGFRIEKLGRTGHPAVLRPDGEPLRDERGVPLCITSTATGPVVGDLARIRRALRRLDFTAQARATPTGELGRLLKQLPHQAVEQREAIRAELRRRQAKP